MYLSWPQESWANGILEEDVEVKAILKEKVQMGQEIPGNIAESMNTN